MQFPLILLALVLAHNPICSKEQDFMSDAAAVRFSFSGSPEKMIKGTSTEIGLRQWTLITPLYYNKGEAWSFAAGLRYEGTEMEFSDASLLDESWLQSIDFPLVLMKEQSEKLNLMLLFNPTMAGDYDSIDGDSFNYLTILGARYRTSDTFQWFFGAVHTTGYDDNLISSCHWLPLGGLRKLRSTLCRTIPKVQILDYRFAGLNSWRALFRIEMEHQSWLWRERFSTESLSYKCNSSMELP